MNFRNKKHAERFFEAVADGCISNDNKDVMAAVYLLTVRKKVWEHFKGHVDGEDGISPSLFESFVSRNETEEALVSAAEDLLFCLEGIILSDLTDGTTIPDEAFMAIWYAVSYSRYGFENGLPTVCILD